MWPSIRVMMSPSPSAPVTSIVMPVASVDILNQPEPPG